jgi:hypothetical protein
VAESFQQELFGFPLFSSRLGAQCEIETRGGEIRIEMNGPLECRESLVWRECRPELPCA